jgi:tRNA(Ser,Leu) C12 N-acetylase TAN1
MKEEKIKVLNIVPNMKDIEVGTRKEDKERTPQQWFLLYFNTIMNTHGVRVGLKETDRYAIYKIRGQLEEAVTKGAKMVEISASVFEVLVRVKQEAPLTFDKMMEQVEHLIDNAEEKKEPPKTGKRRTK